ncbi:MAG TPA: class I SAM-dependent methyltransferase [Streptosporangiaceae bacterium]
MPSDPAGGPPGARASSEHWAASFTEVFAQPASAVEARVWGAVLGDEYPAEVAPYSYTSRSELARIAEQVRTGPGELLADVGSGRGGPGLWVAATTGADYLAVDIAAAGLAQVRDRAARLGLADRVRTAEGSFEDLPLPDGGAAAVMSIDALLFTPSKQAAARELARVLRPGGRLVLTSWDYHRQPEGRPPQIPDHRPALEAAGFDVLAYDETPDWERRQREIDRLLMESAEDLAAEHAQPVEKVRHDLAEMAATVDTMMRRVLIVAERR